MEFERLFWLPFLFIGMLLFVLLEIAQIIAPIVAAPAGVTYNCEAQHDIPVIECEALVSIFHANPEVTFDPSWLEAGVSPCLWSGVGCEVGSVTSLSLPAHFLQIIPAEISNLPNLKLLDLADNWLTSLPPEIGALAKLEKLYLYENFLTSLPTDIDGLSQLSRLYLNHNLLTILPIEIGDLVNLSHLDLSNNQLTSIPSNIGNLSNLQWLILSGNRLTSVPYEIGNLPNLEFLYLENNQLVTLTLNTGSLPKLKILYLYGNLLTSLPSEIGGFSNLETLYLSHNQLTSLPSEIGDLAKLKLLTLNDNQLMVVPISTGNLVNLRRLDLSSNKLITIPSTFDNLTNLVGLNLSDNELTSLPAEIGDLSGLGDLYVEKNLLDGPLPSYLTTLGLYRFSFYNTTWCEPDDVDIQNWLASIPDVASTGFVCGQPVGAISGQVTLSNTLPVSDTVVMLYRDVFGSKAADPIDTTHTDVQGHYSFTNLGQEINYYVYFLPADVAYGPQYFDAQWPFATPTTITITLGITTTEINAVLWKAFYAHLPIILNE